jgi:hypothetical protein
MDRRKAHKKKEEEAPSPGQLVEELGRIWDARIAKEKEAEALKKQEQELKDKVLRSISKDTLDGFQTTHYSVSRQEQVRPTVKDWDAYWNYVLESGDLSLMEKRPGSTAIKERWEHGEDVPGVESFTDVKLSVRRR